MDNITLERSKEGNELLLHQLKLIEGKFSKREALNILNSVVDVKINLSLSAALVTVTETVAFGSLAFIKS